MRIDAAFLRSKVARRIFLLFIGCALLPITALAVLSYGSVTRQLQDQAREQLHQAGKVVGMAIHERLLFLETQMEGLGETVAPGRRGRTARAGHVFEEHMLQQFVGLALMDGTGAADPLLGQIRPPVDLTPEERRELRSGRTAIFTRARPPEPTRVFMARTLDPAGTGETILLGEVNSNYLWGGEDNPIPPLTELCVLQSSDLVLLCTIPIPPAELTRGIQTRSRSKAVQFEWRDGEERYMASAWQIFMPARFAGASWTVVLSESRANVLAPLAYFRALFLPLVILSFLVVTLLSIRQIRRSLVPLERLQEGTRRIATRDFDSRVSVDSGDEFEELATSFNTMASRLGRQFHAQAALTGITQAVLSSFDVRQIVETILARMQDVCPCDQVGVLLPARAEIGAATLYSGSGGAAGAMGEEPVLLKSGDVAFLRTHPCTVVQGEPEMPSYLLAYARRGIQSCAILPVAVEQRISAVIILGYLNIRTPDQDDLAHARQLADQVAVGLSNARLLDELERLNWGTLTALARTIDAKSPWTAGHSERVTNLALEIGLAMGLGIKELEVLRRGGLLHDIGKIGISPEILDKPGKLTEDEARIMRDHTRIGVRILEPIAAFAEALPIVLQHHEAFDGAGYPDGLKGEAIDLGARIFSVADVVDAMSSDRPYRQGMDHPQVIEYVLERSGRTFDPKVVEAFLQVMADQERRAAAGEAAQPPLPPV